MMRRWGMVLLGGLAWMPQVSAADGVALTTRVSGVVERVWVLPGQRVKQGTVLLRLDSVIPRALLDEASADVARLDVDVRDSQRELDRAQELFKRTVSSTSELDTATTRHARAQAALQAAKARQTIAQKNLTDTELKAPFDGRVTAVPGLPGTVVTAACQPVTLVVMRRE